MNDLQKMGGVAALLMAAAFVVGFVVAVALVVPEDYGSLDVDPTENVSFLVEYEAVMYAWNLVIYVAFGVFLVVLALALYERLKDAAPPLVQIATAFGLIWAGLVIASGMVANIGTGVVVDLYDTDPAQAGTVWLSLHFVLEGLGGGVEIVGGLWILLLSWVALRAEELPRALNYIGVLAGVAGVITVVPVLGDLAAIFGIGSVAWFVWLGIIMLRGSASATA